MAHTEYNAWIAGEKEKYLQFLPQDVSSVLDVGCGRGEFLSILKAKGFEVEGCDIDNTLLEKSAHFAKVKKASAMELSSVYPTSSFDLVTCLHTLEHLVRPYDALLELKAVTRKYVFLAVPNVRYIAHKERSTHLYSWDGDTFRNLIKSAGLKISFLKQDRTNMFPNIIRLTPILNRLILKLITGPNELVALCSK